MLPPPIHVAGPSNPLLTPGSAADWGFMTGTLIGVGGPSEEWLHLS